MKFLLRLSFLLFPVIAVFSRQLPEECTPPASLEQPLRNKPPAQVFAETGAWFEQHSNQRCALAAFQKAVQLEPQSSRAHYTLGAALFRAQQLSAAAREFRLALKYKPDMAIAHSSLGSVLMDLGKPREAEAEFREAFRLAPQLVAALVGLGMLRANQGDNQEAEKILRQAIERDPKDEKAHLNLGLVLAKQQKFADAEAQVDQAVRLAPQDAAALAAAGRVKARIGNTAEGVALVRKAVALAPESAMLHLDLGIVLTESFDFASALPEIDEAVRLAPRSALAHLRRGNVLLDLGGNADAKPDLELARQLAPQMPEPYYFLAVIEKQAGNFGQAAALLKNVVKLQPSNGMAWNMLGQCFERESQIEEAIASWRQALAIEPDNVQALWGLAKAVKPTDPQEAAHLMARYREVQNNRRIADQAGVLANDALAAGAAHDWPEAIRQFEEAIALCGDCAIKADLHKKLGLTECQMGNLDTGEKELRMAQTLKPADPDIERVLKRIAEVRARQK
ncbi:MAG TPA: tetratricopeptide repeat protein [Candidatus Sulfotelmatobacter sp.]|nr:tetratricopeptide repeat protein [Candidatus Sulfotelmatobacter sp.]